MFASFVAHCRHSFRVHSIIICIESCLFGLFVITIFVDQVCSIVNDRSLIDSLKSDSESLTSPNAVPPARVLFRQVFGPGRRIDRRSILSRASDVLSPRSNDTLATTVRSEKNNVGHRSAEHVSCVALRRAHCRRSSSRFRCCQCDLTSPNEILHRRLFPTRISFSQSHTKRTRFICAFRTNS